MKELRKSRKENNLCISCGGVKDREGAYCIKCNDRYNKLKYGYTLKNVENGKCATCSKPLDREGWFCKSCANKLNTRAKERSAYRRLNNLCVQCGTPTDGGSYCQRCRDMRMDRYRNNKFYL